MPPSPKFESLVPGFALRFWTRLRSSPLGYRLASGAFWSLSGVFITRALGLASSVFVARMLGKESFGELGIIQSTVGMFQVFAGLGLGMTATKYVAQYREKDPARAGRIIGLSSLVAIVAGGIVTVALLVFTPWLASHTLAAPQLTGLLRLGSVMLFLGAINNAQTGALVGFEAFKSLARIRLYGGGLIFPLMVGGVYWRGLEGAVWAMVVLAGFNCLLFHLALRAEARKAGVPLGYADCGSELKVLWKFSLPAAFSGIMVVPINWVCSAIMVNQPGGYAQMGVFNAANQWRTAILFLPMGIEAIALPVLASLQGRDDRKRYRKALGYNVAFNVGTALLAGVVVAAFSAFIMKMYGPGFEAGRTALILLAFTSVSIAAANILGRSIISRGKMWGSFTINFVWALTMVGFTWSWAYQGATGFALANFAAYAVQLLLVIGYCFWRVFPEIGKEEPES